MKGTCLRRMAVFVLLAAMCCSLSGCYMAKGAVNASKRNERAKATAKTQSKKVSEEKLGDAKIVISDLEGTIRDDSETGYLHVLVEAKRTETQTYRDLYEVHRVYGRYGVDEATVFLDALSIATYGIGYVGMVAKDDMTRRKGTQRDFIRSYTKMREEESIDIVSAADARLDAYFERQWVLDGRTDENGLFRIPKATILRQSAGVDFGLLQVKIRYAGLSVEVEQFVDLSMEPSLGRSPSY